MKIAELIEKLKEIESVNGNVEVNIGNDIGSDFTLRNVERKKNGRIGTLKETLDYYDPNHKNAVARNTICMAFAEGMAYEWKIYDEESVSVVLS